MRKKILFVALSILMFFSIAFPMALADNNSNSPNIKIDQVETKGIKHVISYDDSRRVATFGSDYKLNVIRVKDNIHVVLRDKGEKEQYVLKGELEDHLDDYEKALYKGDVINKKNHFFTLELENNGDKYDVYITIEEIDENGDILGGSTFSINGQEETSIEDEPMFSVLNTQFNTRRTFTDSNFKKVRVQGPDTIRRGGDAYHYIRTVTDTPAVNEYWRDRDSGTVMWSEVSRHEIKLGSGSHQSYIAQNPTGTTSNTFDFKFWVPRIGEVDIRVPTSKISAPAAGTPGTTYSYVATWNTGAGHSDNSTFDQSPTSGTGFGVHYEVNMSGSESLGTYTIPLEHNLQYRTRVAKWYGNVSNYLDIPRTNYSYTFTID
ncbi:hypothetical protein AWH56_008850 [Anaerobacillus isosaccharinicus]|uniref:Uncharacterized protein n=1 Tax=Anaerobacillus isosaccharinicus TaxID=1532552 RepID=A0A1S2L1C4_9BACI|nr:hypothetical protein [Anaerobacillus isosaccharinicus]MBA5588920.1 hypothetical protein [Anaerobacillus isosaccharinicus]QOY37669.1 hypothetical protein AWH56_008850 [Anaerobacillus isosaccharinicus]